MHRKRFARAHRTQMAAAGKTAALALACVCSFSASAYGAAPSPPAGAVITSVSATADGGNDTAIDANGKIVVVGWTQDNTGSRDFFVARYNADGTADNTFSQDGVQQTDLGGSEHAEALVVAGDGKIVVVGHTYGQDANYIGNTDIAVVRYNADGSLDGTFGTSGVRKLHVGKKDSGKDVVIQGGRILVAGQGGDDGHNILLAAFDANGALDATFGSGGIQTTAVAGSASSTAEAVAIAADGRIAIAGYSTGPATATGAEEDFVTAVYNADGSPRTSYSGDGLSAIDYDYLDTFSGVGFDSAGRVVAVGSTVTEGYDNTAIVARFTAAGDIDSSFGSAGYRGSSGSGTRSWNSVYVLADGKLLVGGTTSTNMSAARYSSDGAVDETFGNCGRGSIDLGGWDIANGMVLDAAGKLVLAGLWGQSDGQERHTAVARLTADGWSDGSFGPTGGGGGSAPNCGSQEDTSGDACSNLDGIQTGEWFYDVDDNCLIDYCPNVAGYQASAPAGMVKDASGSCVTPAAPVVKPIVLPLPLHLVGKKGADVLKGLAANDKLYGMGGADKLYGNGGDDKLYGGAGKDLLDGGLANDLLVGGPGKDKLLGGAGNDTIDARDKKPGDVIKCGPGKDVVKRDKGDKVAKDCEKVK